MDARLAVATAVFALAACAPGFDPTAPRPYPCDPTLSSATQCAPGWRCGLEKVCHDEGQALPYLCLSDSDCEQQWTCNPLSGHCQAPIDDGLRVNYALGSLAAERIHPTQTWGLPAALETSLPETAALGGVNGNLETTQSVAIWNDGGFSMWSRSFRVPPNNLGLYVWNSATFAVATPPLEMTLTFNTAWLLHDGGVDAISIDGGTVSFPAQRQHLRASCGRSDCAVIGFTSGSPQINVFSPTGGNVDFTPFASPVVDVAASEFEPDAAVLVATTTDVQEFLVPVNDSCAADSVVPPGVGRVLRLRPWHASALALESVNPDGGAPLLSLMQPPSPGVTPCDPAPWTPVFVGCGECPSGSLADFLPVAGFDEPRLELRCVLDGGAEQRWALLHQFPGLNCEAPQPISIATANNRALLEEPFTVAQSTAPGTAGFVSPHGSLWVEAFDGGGGISGSEGFEGFTNSPQFLAGVGQNLIAFEDNRVFFWTCEDGFRRGTSGSPFSPLLAEIENAPHWLLSGDPSPSVLSLPTDQPTSCAIQDSRAAPALAAEVGVIASGSGSFAQSGTGSLVTAPSGRRFIVVSGDDAIFSAELGAADAGPAQWGVRSVPSALDSIISMTASASDDDGGVVDVQGYVVTAGGGLFNFSGTSAQKRWGTQELIVAGTPQKVWSDGTRSRVGSSDGTVTALPSQLAIGSAMSGGAADFAQYCGTTVALTAAGPLWLASGSDGGRLGSWMPLPFDPTPLGSGGFIPPGGTTAGFEAGKLRVAGDELYLLSDLGPVFRISADGGCPP